MLLIFSVALFCRPFHSVRSFSVTARTAVHFTFFGSRFCLRFVFSFLRLHMGVWRALRWPLLSDGKSECFAAAVWDGARPMGGAVRHDLVSCTLPLRLRVPKRWKRCASFMPLRFAALWVGFCCVMCAANRRPNQTDRSTASEPLHRSPPLPPPPPLTKTACAAALNLGGASARASEGKGAERRCVRREAAPACRVCEGAYRFPSTPPLLCRSGPTPGYGRCVYALAAAYSLHCHQTHRAALSFCEFDGVELARGRSSILPRLRILDALPCCGAATSNTML